ncbi:hypothetical protein RUM44_005902 [Polyplax serrata]|uniref:Uncharacterized protein n=1 Tax=Polyplax serrata TaxID=468196 RepID=A0ABR1B090_POLSC
MEKEWRTSSQIRDEDVRQVQAFLKDDLTEPEMSIKEENEKDKTTRCHSIRAKRSEATLNFVSNVIPVHYTAIKVSQGDQLD